MMEDDAGWYRKPDEKVRPGDIFQLTPSFRALKPPMLATGNREERKGREYVELFGSKGGPVPDRVAKGQQDGAMLLPARLSFGILLTRGCEVENGKVRQLAVLRPLAEIQTDGKRPADDLQADIIEGRMFAAHYLPEAPAEFGVALPDSYVDFRYVCTVNQGWLETLVRPISLTRGAVHQDPEVHGAHRTRIPAA